jgi:hypothetical protein
MKYHTADGHEIVRDGVYKDAEGRKFICLGLINCIFPIIGYYPGDDASEDRPDSISPSSLTLWREPAEQVEVWEVLWESEHGGIYINAFNGEMAAREFAPGYDKGRILTIRLKEIITVGGV